ncbi:MAG TPA: hypothetical protein VJZ00_02950 [Thermoanaerobaculia bacterium]|nr:hypothetical protein [Thermoanaerobaculia bacterium]
MQWMIQVALVLTLFSCNAPRATHNATVAANSFTRQNAAHQLRASVAGSDCGVLLISTETALDDDIVESIQYGTGVYGAFGGAEEFAGDRGFRAVVYRDSTGELWTYGATTRNEARGLPQCK